MRPLLVLIAVTAVWGVTFVQVKDAIALYPLFAFLALLGQTALFGCAVIMAGIVIAEPAAAGALARLVRRP